jgi:hypothetical protein
MLFTRTPREVHSRILAFCAKINGDSMPTYLPIHREPGCLPLECFRNVRRKVAENGGRIQFGWAIWEWPSVYIEAEHHAVYEPPDGTQWVDITPCAEGEEIRRLFLADDSAKYDFDNEGLRRDNFRMALADDETIQLLFNLAARKSEILNTIPGIGQIVVRGAPAQELSEIQRQQENVISELAIRYTPRNARCFCASGKKFKHCHGMQRM